MEVQKIKELKFYLNQIPLKKKQLIHNVSGYQQPVSKYNKDC